jgi:beta-lactamase superfamily II metal-dependent hydrolase
MTLVFIDWLKPSREAVDMLTRADAKILRTDKQWNIEVVSDGTNWKVL